MLRILCIVLLIGLVAGCYPAPSTQLTFIVNYQGKTLPCADNSSLMWYLSNFSTAQPHSIAPGQFALPQVALIGANCSDEAWQVELTSDIDGKSLSFDLGVPWQLNHQNPLTASAPLNVSEMFWSWQLGHKFLRFDGSERFAFHLGSTGCKSASKLRAPKEPCRFPNRYRFNIEQFDSSAPITFDLDKLFNGVNMAKSCMSEQHNPVCQQLFINLASGVFYQE